MNKWYSFRRSVEVTNAGKVGDAYVDNVAGVLNIDLEGEVGYEISASQFKADLQEQGEFDKLVLHINSPGGSVIEGFALVDILDAIKVPKTAVISGWAASMASIIACACDQVKMSKSAWMVIHNPWSCLQGDSKELRKMADVLDKMKESALDVYAKHTAKSRDEISQLLDAETWIRGEDAVGEGWNFQTIDNTDNTSKENAQMQLNLKALKGFRNLPAALMNMVTASAPEPPAPETPAAAAIAPVAEIAAVEPVAVVEAPVAASFLAEIEGLKAKLAAVETAKVEQETISSASAVRINELTAELLNAKAALAKLSPGLQAPEAEITSWDDAMSSCGNNYVQARKTYPDVYNQMLLKSKSK